MGGGKGEGVWERGEGDIQFQLQLAFNRLVTNRDIQNAAIVLCKSLHLMCGQWLWAELCVC